jgi:hypothetical protein
MWKDPWWELLNDDQGGNSKGGTAGCFLSRFSPIRFRRS